MAEGISAHMALEDPGPPGLRNNAQLTQFADCCCPLTRAAEGKEFVLAQKRLRCSVHRLDVEGLGIVFLEASATGLPVIAGTSGGAPETVEDGVTGDVVDGRDGDALVAALVRQLSDPALRERMGRAGRELMERRWTWPGLVAGLVEAVDAR